MDPVNLSGTQNTPSDCKNYAGVRSFAGCACCGLKDYPQNIPQAYCFTALCPGLSKCKSSQDHPQDNFAVPHPFFSTFPFQQHFFHSTILPPNFCCAQKLSGDAGANTSLKQSKNEQKINQQQTDNHHPPQKENSDFADSNKNTNEDVQKNNPEPASPHTHQTESQPNTVFQRCICGDSIPWACSPFIVPVLSYCFLWNSQPTSSLLPKTYNSYITETLCQKNSKKQENQKYSCESEPQEQPQTPTQEQAKTTSDKTTDSVEIFQECLESNEVSKTELKMEEHEESTEQDESECMKNDSDGNYEEEEDGSETGDDSEIRDQTESEIRDQTESEEIEESLKADENDSPAPESSENLPKDLEYSEAPDTESSTNLKSPQKSSEHSLNDMNALSENPSNNWTTEAPEVDMNPPIVSNEESEEKNSDSEEPDTSKTNLREAIVKKCIKNFTVTDKINGAPSQEVQMSAAGDLGAESCDSCKIPTSPDENDEEMSKESFKTGAANEESEPKVSDEGDGKNVGDIQNSGIKFKSGIAKLSNNSNIKAPKSSSVKTAKKCKNYCNEKQGNAVRFKHCCFPTENTNSKNECPPKIQKAKKCALALNPSPGKSSGVPATQLSFKLHLFTLSAGACLKNSNFEMIPVFSKVSRPETPKKSVNTRQSLKKESTPRKPARPVTLSENSQKPVKTLLKK